jgi:RNA polymerase sigma-70 factor (ECF subfamily)
VQTSSFTLTADGGTGPQDLILVQRAVRGERVAIDEVLVRLSCVVRFVFRLNKTLGYGLSTESLEDVVQQVYMAVWPRLGEFEGSSAIESWVYGFCRNCLRAETRRRRMVARVPLVEPDELDRRPDASIGPAPTEALALEEGIDSLRVELDRLKPVEREAVVLRHLEGWSFETIARRQGIPASTVKDRCYRALLRLKGRMKSRDVSA